MRAWEETQASLEDDFAAPLTGSSCWHDDPRAVSQAEALSYYAGLPSEPVLVYRTGEPWSPPRGPEAQRRKKELRPVFAHPIVDLWRASLGMAVADIMDAQTVYFTTIDVVRFRMLDVDQADSDDEDADEPPAPADGPVTIWVGVLPESTSPSTAHTAAQAVLALLARHAIADVDVAFRESLYTRLAGAPRRPTSAPDPLAASALTPAAGASIAARRGAHGTLALSLDAGDVAHTLLGLTSRHALFSDKDGNFDYVGSAPARPRDVVLLGPRAYTELVDAIRVKIGRHAIAARHRRAQIAELLAEEHAGDARAARHRVKTEALLAAAEDAMAALAARLHALQRRKDPAARVLGRVLRAPRVALGAGEERFVEDWAVFCVERGKLGDGFRGNVLDIGTTLCADGLPAPSLPAGALPTDLSTSHLPLRGILTDAELQRPQHVVTHGAARGASLGTATGAFSLVREYFACDVRVHRTAFAWAVLGAGSDSAFSPGSGLGLRVGEGASAGGEFARPGDSGAAVVDLQGRVGGVLVGGAGRGGAVDVAYATPFWWVLERVRAGGFPNASINVG
ncbi:hypothetical protein PsYK624_033120 [Phanerochaete sordida]|uniref:Uncharacterized protein n=1 Tax=Phanerochaete sordida TaxID=48140 RepID=A0A9P3G431_9APHY|nr:hypothetical protein PsYK624_033120 [Phanerochaete sordida]